MNRPLADRGETAVSVLVWVPDRGPGVDPDWIGRIGERVGGEVYALGVSVPGAERVGEHRSDWAGALRAIAERTLQLPLLIVRSGLSLPEPFLVIRRLIEDEDMPHSVVFPGNHAPGFNPFSAWPLSSEPSEPARLVYWCGDALTYRIETASRECVLLSAAAVGGGEAALEHGPAVLVDDAFVRDADRPVCADDEDHGDGPNQPALGELRLRLSRLAESDPAPVAAADPDAPVTLHIAHSWGGGVWRWIDDFIAGDADGVNLVLVADGDATGEVCGRRLQLFVGGIGRGRVREIPLAPEIVSTVAANEQYRRVLERTIRRFGVGRIIVSSLIGHSLDCLSSGVPTAQVQHDFYPVWPLLDFDPLPFIHPKRGVNRTLALARHGDTLRLRPRDAGFWKRIADSWRRRVEAHGVRLIAPTEHVIERWKALNPGSDFDIAKIPHAFRPFSDRKRLERPAPDEPLHLVIPGRLTQGKGLGLLESALPELRRFARLTALGCGREAFRLFGQPGVDLVVNYRHESFPALIRTLRPHAALFLSTVPETWNYALSEVRAVGLAPIATNVGSFPERIRDGKDGLLFEPEREALIECVRKLAATPERLVQLADRKPRQQTPRRLVARFAEEVPLAAGERFGHHACGTEGLMLGRAAGELVYLERRYTAVCARLEALSDEIDERTRWAEKLERQFRERSAWNRSLQGELESARAAYAKLEREFEQRTEWAMRLDRMLADTQKSFADLQRELQRRTDWALNLESEKQELERALSREVERVRGDFERVREDFEREQEQRARLETDLEHARREIGERNHELIEARKHLERLAGEYDGLQRQQTELAQAHRALEVEQAALAGQHEALRTEYDRMVASRSWRLTRPLRFAGRTLRSLRQRNLANPMTWVRLLRRFFHHWRLRGLKATLAMLQNPPAPADPPAAAPAPLPPGTEEVAEPVALPEVDEPVATVVVPVYNQLGYTAACLESMAAARTATPFEVVVVDDESADATPDWLARCRGLRWVRNAKNLGFIGSCNRGASLARGRFVVFLNNDTRVTDDWLDELVATFERSGDVGVVGGKLVFADGSLQEAGGIVFRDGSGWNYGRGDDPDQPEYRFVSEADYVSGACLAIRTELFRELGGFDDHFAPAYYEDTDLCFRVRRQGFRVLCQPACTIVHYEGVTSGTHESGGAKRHQAINRDRFRERWADELAQYPENPQRYSPELARRFRYRRFTRRALVIDAVTPAPDHDSGSVRMFALLRLLGEMGFRTSFMPENLAWTGRHSSDLQQIGVEMLTAPWVSDPEQWLARHGAELDLVIVSRHYVLSPLVKVIRAHCPGARLVFDTVDLHFLREEREAEVKGTAAAARAAERTRREELALIKAADATLVVSEYERELLGRLAPSETVSVVSNIHSVHGPGKTYDRRRGLVFVGGFQHPPNIDAAEWLIDGILPEVRRSLPDVELHLIGSRMPESLRQRRAPGLKVHGFVADLEPYMTGCRVSLAPLRFGAGVKGKVNQAMSHGLPVVATSCAAEGMYTEHGRDVLLADDTDSFAQRVVEVYRDRELWQRLADNGRANVARHFSIDAAREAVAEVLTRMGLALETDVVGVGASTARAVRADPSAVSSSAGQS